MSDPYQNATLHRADAKPKCAVAIPPFCADVQKKMAPNNHEGLVVGHWFFFDVCEAGSDTRLKPQASSPYVNGDLVYLGCCR